MDSIDSESSYSSNGLNNDYYIKKHINAVPRGESAIFGEKHEESNQDLFPPSPQNSHQYEEQENNDHSKIDLDDHQPESKKEEKEEIKMEQQDQHIADLLNEMEQPKQEIPQKQIEEEPIKIEEQENPAIEEPAAQEVQQINQELIKQPEQYLIPEQKIDAHLKEDQQIQPLSKFPIREQQNNQIAQNQINPAQIQKTIVTQQEIQRKLALKRSRLQRLSMNENQVIPIIQILKRNTQSIETAYNHILNQNTILAQFKEDASRKLEENIKSTLKEKMNEINRQNSKEIKDIKNSSLAIQDLLQKHDKRIEKMEKNIDEILNLLKGKK